MEGVNIKVFATVVLVLVMFAGQSTADFKECYAQCFIFCALKPDRTLFSCSLECLRDCIIPPASPMGIRRDTKSFCKLGCASSLCTNFSTIHSPGAEKVEGCVDSCSELCSKNY